MNSATFSPEVRTALTHILGGIHKHDIMFPEDARIEYPEFSPFRAGPETVCWVFIPAIVNMQKRELFHEICDGDRLY